MRPSLHEHVVGSRLIAQGISDASKDLQPGGTVRVADGDELAEQSHPY